MTLLPRDQPDFELELERTGQALILTLSESLGEAFTAEVRDAWIAVYELISSAMQNRESAASPV